MIDAENKKGKWKVMKIRPAGDPTKEHLEILMSWCGAMKGKTVGVQQDADVPAASGDSPF